MKDSDKCLPNVIKEYQYWTLYIHDNQQYLGRVYVWCKRENALDLVDATEEERKELFAILFQIKKALTKTFQPDWFNYAFLGNETQHLHGHIVPRYAQEKEFMGLRFRDREYGHNWKTDKSFEVSREVVQAIRQTLQNNLAIEP